MNSIVPLVYPMFSSHETARSFHQCRGFVSGGPRTTRWRCTNRQNPGMTFSVIFRIAQFPMSHDETSVTRLRHTTRVTTCKTLPPERSEGVGQETAWLALRTESMTVQHLHIFTFVYHVSQRDTGCRSYHSEAQSLPPGQRVEWCSQNHICNDKSATDDEGSRGFDNKSLSCLEVVCRVNREHFVERRCGVGQRRARRNRPNTHHNL
jgi:hypothetical protein